MKHLKRIISSLVLVVMLSISAMPALALAEEGTTDPAPATEPTTEPAPEPTPAPTPEPEPTPTQGPTEPTGPSGPTGVIPRYAFDEKTGKWVATRQETFYWDNNIHRYVSPYYRYQTSNGWYYVIAQPVVAPASTSTSPTLGTASTDPGATSTQDYDQAKKVLAALLGLSDPLNSNTGPGSTNTSTLNNEASAIFNILSAATVNNNNTSTATSGDATVSGNAQGGSATTGMASVLANFLNLINSAWGWSSGSLNYFLGNFFGDHTGDLTLSPTSTSGGGGSLGCFFCFGGTLNANQNTGADSTNTATTNGDRDLTINYQPTGTINNNANLLANSGDAGVTGNTVGGNATSGDAVVELNIINMINSAISSGGSFFGLLNIFGDFNGDILFPANFLTGALGGSGGLSGSQVSNTNTGPDSTNTATNNANFTGNITDNSTSTFNNNINTGAASGNALVDSNTRAGDASTGQATTNTNTYNLYNAGVSGSNAVLVLVNVLGTWVGMIMNVPNFGGSSSALLGGNAVVSNDMTGPNSTNTATNNANGTLDVNYSPTSTINNNINAGAISGDASVTGNTVGGNATTGDAKVASNVVNIMGSRIDLTNWFGVLVINVFGNWFGSVDKNTSAGTLGIGGSSLALSLPNSSKTTLRSSNPLSVVTTNYSGTPYSGTGSNDITSTGLQSAKIKLASATNVAKFATAKKTAANTSMLFILTAVVLLGSGGLLSLSRKLGRV